MNSLVPAGRAPNIIDVFRQMEDDANRKDPSRPARFAEAKRQKQMERQGKHDAILGRYGSEEAAIAGSAAEQRLAAAVAKFRRPVMHKFLNSTFPRDSLDGWMGDFHSEPVPDRVRRAVESATPLPTTIEEAADEYNLWRERDVELQHVYMNFDADTQLPLECQLRQEIVQALLETGLRACNLQDLIARQRYAVEMGQDGLADGLDAAVLADLEHLAASGAVL